MAAEEEMNTKIHMLTVSGLVVEPKQHTDRFVEPVHVYCAIEAAHIRCQKRG